MTSICETCGCHKDESCLTVMNRRIHTIIAKNRRQIQNTLELPRWLIDRLTDDPEYQFGFSDFLPSVTNDFVVGRIYVAVYCGRDADDTRRRPDDADVEARNAWRDDWRFFATDILSPNAVVNGARSAPFEYRRGDMFKLGPSYVYITGREVTRHIELGDDLILSWIVDHMLVIRDFVINAIGHFASDVNE